MLVVVLQVSSHWLCLPMSLSHGELHVYQKGKSMLIQSNFKLKVLYNWDDHVVIKLPAALSGKVCRMCRNNRDLWDDALPPDSKQAWDIVEFGWSWKVTGESGHCQDTCDGECELCGWDQAVQRQRQRPGVGSCPNILGHSDHVMTLSVPIST